MPTMQRFQVGQQVLIRELMGMDCHPLRPATITKVYGPSSLLYDYQVLTNGRSCPVQDSWLASTEYVIQESFTP